MKKKNIGSSFDSWLREEGIQDGRKVEEGSGNVFADLGFPGPEREQLEAKRKLENYRTSKGRSRASGP